MRALCFQFVLTSPSPGVGHSLEKRTFLRFQVYQLVGNLRVYERVGNSIGFERAFDLKSL